MKKRAYIQPYARQVILDAEQMVANTPQVTFDDGTPPSTTVARKTMRMMRKNGETPRVTKAFGVICGKGLQAPS